MRRLGSWASRCFFIDSGAMVQQERGDFDQIAVCGEVQCGGAVPSARVKSTYLIDKETGSKTHLSFSLTSAPFSIISFSISV